MTTRLAMPAREMHLSQDESGVQHIIVVSDSPDGNDEWAIAMPITELKNATRKFTEVMERGSK